MSYTAPAGNAVPLPLGSGLTYSPPAGNSVPLPLADELTPTAAADAYPIAINTARTIAAPGVLGNDTLASGSITSHTSPTHGTLSLNSDGSFTYTPTTGYTGPDSFTYMLQNAFGTSVATVSLTIYAPPVAIGHAYNVLKNTALTIAAPGVLNGCTINGATITSNTSPAHGSLVLQPDGSFTYTPTTGYTGSDSFQFTLSNYAGSSTSTISLTVSAAPAAVSDSYAVAQYGSISVAAPGPLYNDDLEGASVSLGTSTTHGSLTFNSDGSFVYTPTGSFSGTDSFTYVLTNAVGSSTGTVSIVVQALPATPRYTYATTRGSWGVVARESRRVSAAWTAPAQQTRRDTAPWGSAPERAARAVSSFSDVPQRPSKVTAPWRSAPEKRTSVAGGFGLIPRRAIRTAAPWAWLPQLHHSAFSASQLPPRRSTHPRALAGWLPPAAVHPIGYYLFAPQRLRQRFLVPWGWAPRVVWTPHPSPGVIPPIVVPPVPVYVPPSGAYVDLPLECLWFDDPGDQIAIPFGPFACYASTLHRKRYIVLNSVSVVRLPERTPISVAAGSIQASRDAMYIDYSLTLADPAHLAYLLPDSGGNKLVEININGHVFTSLIETYQQQRKFPARGVSVTGRSRSVVLDDPHAPQVSYVQNADLTAQQLVDRELQFTGFTADYGALDWPVPAGTYHYDLLTPMTSIKTIAAASGAIVQSHPWDEIVRVLPRYPASPWTWATTAVDKTIPADIIVSDSLQPASKPLYNYVLVSGQQVGVSDPIVRDGSAGDIRAPQIVDALIVTHPVALERGRNVLSDRGEQAAITMQIPLGVPADTSLPGLILPQDFCSVVDVTAWHGLCTATRIDFARTQSSNGAEALIVDQTITLERHYSDAD